MVVGLAPTFQHAVTSCTFSVGNSISIRFLARNAEDLIGKTSQLLIYRSIVYSILRLLFSNRPRQSASFDVERHEFLCPLCKSLSNTVLPILPNRSASSVRPSGSEAGQADMSIWLEGLQLLADNSREVAYAKTENTNVYDTCGPSEMETKLGSMKSKLFVNVLLARSRSKIAATLKEMASLFVQSVYTVRYFFLFLSRSDVDAMAIGGSLILK